MSGLCALFDIGAGMMESNKVGLFDFFRSQTKFDDLKVAAFKEGFQELDSHTQRQFLVEPH